MGPSCSGKSSIANELKKSTKAKVYAGKDYLRFAKNQDEAWRLFRNELHTASGTCLSESVVYIITDKNKLPELQQIQNARFVRFTASLDVLKARFAKRTGGHLPHSVEKMLEQQFQIWEPIKADICIDTSAGQSSDEMISKIIKQI
jgi:gluconate kinase